MNHSFNTEIAQEIGVIPAIMLEHIAFWVLKNKANQTAEKDGRSWTFSTMEGFQTYFPYLTAKQIRYALEKLESGKYLETGCFNNNHFDRTKWYTLTEKAGKFYPIQNKKAEEKNPSVELPKLANLDDKIGKSELPKLENGSAKIGKSNKDIEYKDIEEDIYTPPISPPRGGCKPPKKSSYSPEWLISEGVSPDVAGAFASVRKAKKAPLSKLAVDGFKREALKAGISLEDAVRFSAERGYQGFQADWYAKTNPAPKKMSLEEAIEARHAKRDRMTINVNAKEVCYEQFTC